MEEAKQLNVAVKKKLNKIGSDSYFLTAPRAEEMLDIIETWENNGRPYTIKKLHEKLKKLDPNVLCERSMIRFLDQYKTVRTKRAAKMINRLKGILESDDDGKNDSEDVLKLLLNNAYNKIFTMGNIAITQEMEQIKEQLEKGEPLNVAQKKTVMNWFFKGTEAWAKQRTVDLHAKADERAETLMDGLILAAQYGKIESKDIVDGDYEEVKPKSLKEADGN